MPRSNSPTESWNAAIIHFICYDHLHNADGVVNRVLEKKGKNSRIGHRTVGALLIAELKHNPDQCLLRSLREAVETHSTRVQNEEEFSQFQTFVCEAVSESLFWVRDRKGDGSLTICFKYPYDKREHSDAIQEMNFCMAIITNNVSALRTLLVLKRDLANKKTRYFGLSLHLAARYAGLDVIQTLLNCEAKYYAMQYTESFQDGPVRENLLSNAGSVLRVAALAGRHDVVRLLLPYFRNLHDTWADNEKSKIVLAAARYGDPALVSLLLEKLWSATGTAPPDLCGEILLEAAYMGRMKVVQSMLDKGVSANVQRNDMLSSWPRPPSTAQHFPLQAAAFRGRTDIVKLMLDRGAEPFREKDPLCDAAFGGHESTIQLLLDYGIHLDKKGRKFEAATNRYILEDVARSDHVHIMRLLLENGASLVNDSSNAKSPREESIGESSLCIAIERGNLPMVHCLLEFGVAVKTLAQKSALISVAKNSNRTQMAKLLLDLKVEDTTQVRSVFGRISNIFIKEAPTERIKILRLEPVESESILFHSQGRY